MGDSVPAGTACNCTPYVTLVAQQLATREDRHPSIDNEAVAGLTTSGLLEQIQLPSVRTAIARADLIIITIGANDFDPKVLTSPDCRAASLLDCYQDALATMRQTFTSVLSTVAKLQPPGGRRLVTGYWNDFLDGDVGAEKGPAYVEASLDLTLASNAVLDSLAPGSGAQYVDLYAAFKGDGSKDDTMLLAADGDHPNAAGHRLIARTLLHALTP